MYAISYPVNNLLMGSGSQIIVPAEEQREDKGKLLAYEADRQRAFDEQEADWKGLVHEEAPGRSRKVTESNLNEEQLIKNNNNN